jgi:hypothetical protein
LTPPVSDVHWPIAWKILPTRFPREDLFERLGGPEDRRVLHRLQEITNARARLERGEIHVLRRGDAFPPGCSVFLRAAFAQKSAPSRFCDGTFPVCYSALTLATAVAESRFHRIDFLKRTRESAGTFPMRIYGLELYGHFHDLRAGAVQWADVYSPTSYAASSILGARLWKENSQGIVYDSVRYGGGQCAAIFSPQTIRKYQLGEILLYEWDGSRIDVYQRIE